MTSYYSSPSKQTHPALFRLTQQLFDAPASVFLATVVVFAIVPLGVLYRFPLRLDSNPEKGFDTRGTPAAGPRLAWQLLQPQLLRGSRIVAKVAPDMTKVDGTSETLRNASSVSMRTKRSWADDLVASFSSVACYEDPIPAMSYLTQFIVELLDFEKLFDKKLLDELCSMGEKLAPSVTPFNSLTPYRNIWHAANFFACLAPTSRVNCSYLTIEDVKQVRSTIVACVPHRSAIIECRAACQRHHEIPLSVSSGAACPTTCPAYLGVPSMCAGQMMFDLFYRILPRDVGARPFYLNNFMPVYSYAAYRMYGYEVQLDNFKRLERDLSRVLNENKELTLKGFLMDVKRDLVLEAAVSDSRYSLLAALCVFILIAAYSLSIAYSCAVVAQLTCSVLSALAIYRTFNADFPLLNLIVFVLLISIGSDGAFLLLSTFPSAERLNVASFHVCMRHTAQTMFLTQFSTVVPFFLNVFSSVIAFRSFGLFAGLTLITNYLLLISFLPAFLLIQHRYVNPWLVRMLPSSLWYCFPSLHTSKPQPLHAFQSSPPPPSIHGLHSSIEEVGRVERLIDFIQCTFYEVLPAVLIQGRFVWISTLGFMVIASGYLCLTQMRLPQYNPLQLFHGSNPHEFYDNNAEKLYEFVEPKIGVPLQLRLVWGVERVRSLSHFEPQQLTELNADPRFQLRSVRQLRNLAEQLSGFRSLPFIRHPEKFWPERFVDWSQKFPCGSVAASAETEPAAAPICCNFENARFSSAFLDFCIRLSTNHLPTNYNDTLIYHNTTFELIGYTALLPTRLKYSHRFANLSANFARFDRAFDPDSSESTITDSVDGNSSDVRMQSLPFWYTTEWGLMSTWYDLQRAIIVDCKQSVLISFAVVLIFAAAILRWKCICALIIIISIVVSTAGTVVFLGWEIGVLEGVILVLVVGLSFDYTLHYGASVPNDDGCAVHRIQCSVRRAFVPVLMAALSSVIAGAVMLFSQTHAFYQVAVFLCVSTTLSFIFATFFFLPLLYVFLPADNPKRPCKFCERNQRQLLQLKEFRCVESSRNVVNPNARSLWSTATRLES